MLHPVTRMFLTSLLAVWLGAAAAAAAASEAPAAARTLDIDLGDLTGPPLYALFCPNNLLGSVDVLLVPHHGGVDVALPAALATQPRIAIMNNGATKGGSAETFAMLQRMAGSPNLGDLWQVDRTTTAGAENAPDDRIANLDTTTGHWIKVSSRDDGTFTVTNGRTGQSKSYEPKPR